MKAQDVIIVDGTVVSALGNAMFYINIDMGAEGQEASVQRQVLGHVSGKIRKNYVKILVGDRVQVELSEYNLERGRIIYRYMPGKGSVGV